jgi:hypothetical protein
MLEQFLLNGKEPNVLKVEKMEENDIGYKRSFNGEITVNEQKKMNEEEAADKGKDTTKIYFFIVAIITLLATNVYFYVKYRNSDSQNITILSEKSQMESELDRIEVELDRVTKENVELTEELKLAQENARTKIEELRSKLTQNELDKAEVERAQQQIIQLREAVSKYKRDIEKLKSENALLISERDSLKLSANSAMAKADELETINHDLEQKMDIASALKISSINVNAFRMRRNGKESSETRAKRTDKLRIDFSIADNPLAKKAIYDVYIRVIEPSGNLLIADNKIFEVDGVEMQYTEKTGIEFSNDGKLYSFEWKGFEEFKPGTYTIVLYTSKGTMGKGTIRLS